MAGLVLCAVSFTIYDVSGNQSMSSQEVLMQKNLEALTQGEAGGGYEYRIEYTKEEQVTVYGGGTNGQIYRICKAEVSRTECYGEGSVNYVSGTIYVGSPYNCYSVYYI